MKRAAPLLLLLVLLSGCRLGPNYQRPAVPTPPQFRGATPDAASIAGTKWAELFEDEALKKLLAEALEQNLDLRIASERVLEARARLQLTRAGEFPLVNVQAGFTTSRPSLIGANPLVPANASMNTSYTQAGLSLSWELDFWGRLRRLSEAARAQYLASEEGRRGVIVSLVSDVMSGYFALRERDLELDIARQTGGIAEDGLKLVGLRHERGAATGLDLHQAEQLLYTATAQIASTKRDIEQTENALSLLLGKPPAEVPRGKPLEQFLTPAQVPPGLPSALLDRRPDIRAAEQNLIAANAQIGAVKALYFPQITLTGFLGGQSRALSELFTRPALLANIGPGAVMPLFNAGLVRAGVRYTEAQQREMLLTYQKTVLNAFREVSDALAGYSRTREQRAQQELLVTALNESTRLSTLRYKGGLDSYLQVLDSQRNLFRGQLTLAQLRLQELLSFVQLYKSLGGAWQ